MYLFYLIYNLLLSFVFFFVVVVVFCFVFVCLFLLLLLFLQQINKYHFHDLGHSVLLFSINNPENDKNNKMTNVPSKDSD